MFTHFFEGELLLILTSHPSKFVIRASNDTSTHNLIEHIKICSPNENASTGMLKKFVGGCTYNKAAFYVQILVWIAKRCRPYSIVGDPELVALFKTLYSSVTVPSDRAISRYMKTFYQLCKVKTSRVLKAHRGAIHIGFDVWTASNLLPFLGVTAHRCVDGKIESFILDFIR